MLPLEEAVSRLLARVRPTPGETVALADAGGRVLVDPRVVSAVDVPTFANSSMDGYAVRASDTPGRLRVVGESAAGAVSLPSVEPGTAARIMTGAPVPPGADAVIPIEDVAEDADADTVEVPQARAGAYVRDAAHDTRAGDTIELPGALAPAAVAVLASIGIAEVSVRRRPVVAILSTGDELAAVGEPLGPNQVYDANGVALSVAVTEAGGTPLLLPRLPDDPAAIGVALGDAASRADLIVTTAGVSVGRHDHVRAVLTERGALDFWRIAIQPGKPLAVGEIDGVTVVGLPGNPVSALVVFELVVRPALRAMLGLRGDGRRRVQASIVETVGKDRDRRAFLRVRVEPVGDGWVARPAGGQQSSQLRPMADGNALLVIPEGVEAAEPDVPYEAILLEPDR